MPRSANGWLAIIGAPIATGLLLCAPSCGSFSASGDVADAMTDAPPAADVASPDAAGSPADSAATDGGANLFLVGDFEHGGCDGFGYHSSLTIDPTGHGAGHSCRVCSNDVSPNVFSFDTDIDGVMPPKGAHYVAEAWFRTALLMGPPASGVELTLRTHEDPFVQHDMMFSPYTAVTDVWQMVTIELDIKDPGIPKLEIIVDGQYDKGKCFLVDDLVVRQVP